MGLLKTKKMRTARLTRRQLRHKKTGSNTGVTFKETDRGIIKLAKNTSNLKASGHGVKKDLLKGKSTKNMTAKEKLQKKKAQQKKQK